MPAKITGGPNVSQMQNTQSSGQTSAAQLGQQLMGQAAQGGVNMQGQLGLGGAQLGQVFNQESLLDAVTIQAEATTGAEPNDGDTGDPSVLE